MHSEEMKVRVSFWHCRHLEYFLFSINKGRRSSSCKLATLYRDWYVFCLLALFTSIGSFKFFAVCCVYYVFSRIFWLSSNLMLFVVSFGFRQLYDYVRHFVMYFVHSLSTEFPWVSLQTTIATWSPLSPPFASFCHCHSSFLHMAYKQVSSAFELCNVPQTSLMLQLMTNLDDD